MQQKNVDPAIGKGQQTMGDIAPRLAQLTDEVLFGDIWQRPGLPKRERSLITVATLVALNRSEQLPFHLQRAIDNGVTPAELVELVTHLAFYSGWPTAASAVTALKAMPQFGGTLTSTQNQPK
ncbi:carboxymuconolactone decarboxylase family protein [Undibacterium sp. TJN19]|uniref:carboxymuconolactone decarboxylase family protein n=1 Tax=Undibacterium sp. TJN19 TaxID=3413055 RepID=UPI003BEFC20C